MTTVERIVELIAATSSSLPEDVEAVLRRSLVRERRAKNAAAALNLSTILDNCRLARCRRTPLCQDTGTLAFYVHESLRRRVTPEVLKKAVAVATEKGYLRKNTIDSLDGHSYDDNVCDGAPVVHYYSTTQLPNYSTSQLPNFSTSSVTLLMKGGGSENMSRQYSLPDAALGAGRDLEGVRRCVLDAVVKAQGYGCAPGILGVCVGGDRATAYETAKCQLLRPLDEKQSAFESRLLREANSLRIGPMGLGGKTTLLGVKVAFRPRVPASFFVTVAYMCWACRRRTMEIKG